jgi:hypothetical protein
MLKDVYDIGRDAFSAAMHRKERAERERFNHLKEQLRLGLEARQRTLNVTRFGFTPTPNQVPYAEALVREGFLEPDMHTGRYFRLHGVSVKPLLICLPVWRWPSDCVARLRKVKVRRRANARAGVPERRPCGLGYSGASGRALFLR